MTLMKEKFKDKLEKIVLWKKLNDTHELFNLGEKSHEIGL
jgi:hypothetical protein